MPTKTQTDDDFDWGVGFDVAVIPTDQLPVRPSEPLPPGPDASTAEQNTYAKLLAEHQRLMRDYDAEIAELLDDDTHWQFTITKLDTREQAEAQLAEFLVAHATNPLVRNAGLFRTPAVQWERIEA